MHRTARASIRRGLQQVAERIRTELRKICRCRECGQSASVLDDICEHCGAGSPVRFRVSPSLLLTAIFSQTYLIILMLNR